MVQKRKTTHSKEFQIKSSNSINTIFQYLSYVDKYTINGPQFLLLNLNMLYDLVYDFLKFEFDT